jgi:hypothetical protein
MFGATPDPQFARILELEKQLCGFVTQSKGEHSSASATDAWLNQLSSQLNLR